MKVHFMNETAQARPMRDFINTVRELYKAGVQVTNLLPYVKQKLEKDESIYLRYDHKDMKFTRFGDGIAWSWVRVWSEDELVRVYVGLGVNNGTDVELVSTAHVGSINIHGNERDLKRIRTNIKVANDIIRKISSIPWDVNDPSKCLRTAMRIMKSGKDVSIEEDPFNLLKSSLDLKESVMLGSLSDLRRLFNTEFPAEKWKAGHGIVTSSKPQYLAEHPKNDPISFYYPDGSEGKWFLADGDVFFFSGTLRMDGIDGFVLVVYMDKDNKVMTANSKFVFPVDEKKYSENPKAAERHLSSYLKRTMAKASRFARWRDALDYLYAEQSRYGRSLTESVMLGSLSDLKVFLKKNYPVEEWNTGDSLGRLGLPQYVADEPWGSVLAYYYPDKSEAKWFMLGDYLVLSGTSFSGLDDAKTVQCYAEIYHMDKDTKTVHVVGTFPFFLYSEDFMKKVQGEAKRVSNFMRNLMKKASRLRSIQSVKNFLADESQKEAERRKKGMDPWKR